MAGFRYWNENPQGEKHNDCVTRAITFASGLSYPIVRRKLYHAARLMDCSKLCPTCYSFTIQEVLGGVPVNCDNMSVGEFCDAHSQGIYLIRIKGHLTAIKDGVCYDTWDCRARECDMAWRMHN